MEWPFWREREAWAEARAPKEMEARVSRGSISDEALSDCECEQ